MANIYISNEFIRKMEIDDILKALPKDLYHTAVLVYCGKFDPAEVAALLGIHRSSVYRRMGKIERLVKEAIDNATNK